MATDPGLKNETLGSSELYAKYEAPAQAGVEMALAKQMAKFVAGAYQALAEADLNTGLSVIWRHVTQMLYASPLESITLQFHFGDLQAGEIGQVFLLRISYGYWHKPVAGQWSNVDNPLARPDAVEKDPDDRSPLLPRGRKAPRMVERTEYYLVPAISNNQSGMKPEPSWVGWYQVIMVKLSENSYSGAIHALAGCSMYDILRILQRMSMGSAFNVLEGTYASPPVPGVGTARLRAAFEAVKAKLSSKTPYKDYSLSFAEFSALAPFEQKDIMTFLGQPKTDALAEEIARLVGRWSVKVDKWTWEYRFKTDFTVTWKDLGNGKNGKGRWTFKDDKTMVTTWPPSHTVEYWDRPLKKETQEGMVAMAEGRFMLYATRLDL